MQPNIIQPQIPAPTNEASTSDTAGAAQAAFNLAPSSAAAESPSTISGLTSRKSLRLAVSLAAVALVFVAGYFANSGVSAASQHNASKQAQAFIADLNRGDSKAAYNLASTNLRNQESEGDFASSMGDLKTKSPNPTDTSISFNGRNSTYVVTEDGLPPTDDGTTTGTFTVSLVKSGPLNWKVDSVSVN